MRREWLIALSVAAAAATSVIVIEDAWAARRGAGGSGRAVHAGGVHRSTANINVNRAIRPGWQGNYGYRGAGAALAVTGLAVGAAATAAAYNNYGGGPYYGNYSGAYYGETYAPAYAEPTYAAPGYGYMGGSFNYDRCADPMVRLC